MQCNPCQTKNKFRTKPQRGERIPINGAYPKRGCRDATALQRLGCRAVVPRQPHIIHSRIANADTHGFRIANAEEQGWFALFSSAGVPPCSTACLISCHPPGVPSCNRPSHGVTADSRKGWNAMQPLPNKKNKFRTKPQAGRNPSKARTQNTAAANREIRRRETSQCDSPTTDRL